MPKVILICAHRPKRSPSQRYRFEQYLSFLTAQGFEFTFSYLLSAKDDELFYLKGNTVAKVYILLKSIWIRVREAMRLKDFDIVFIQREAIFLGTSFFEKRAARSGAKVIFDFDDSIWLADTSPGNKKWEFIKKPTKFFENLRYADTVIAGNAYLANKALAYNKNVIVIPTTIDTDFHFPKPELRNKETLVIGWSGSISTVKHFDLLVPLLLKLKNRYADKISFKLIGDKTYKNPLLEVDAFTWTEETEVDQLNSFDIGLMPLPEDDWAEGKCGLKGLSYMACGVATVMSAVSVNKEIIEHGKNGFLAHNESEWLDFLSLLIENKTLREELGKAGRDTVLRRYSVIANRENYLRVFKDR
jgi:glycosyltransferase involved in cell wall biosynthesis